LCSRQAKTVEFPPAKFLTFGVAYDKIGVSGGGAKGRLRTPGFGTTSRILSARSAKGFDMEDFEKKINYYFKKKRLLKEALTHSSYTSSKGSNERLEFLGDSVLSVIVSKHLFETLSCRTEGYLTKLRASLVCESALYGYAQKIGLGGEILLGKGEENTGGRARKSILADAFEALIAAIYLDGGLEAATAFILPFLPNAETLKNGKLITGDYKTVLQEIVQQNPDDKIIYELIGEEGLAHNRTFTVNIRLNGKTLGTGSGTSKKEAERQAAGKALVSMGYKAD
jgi:ribonuclease-3